MKNEKIKKDILPENPGYSIELKASYTFVVLISKYNKSLEEKNLIIISDCPIHVPTDFLTALFLNIFFQSQ